MKAELGKGSDPAQIEAGSGETPAQTATEAPADTAAAPQEGAQQ